MREIFGMTRFFALNGPVSSSSSPSILPSAFCSRLSKSPFEVNLLLQSLWYAMEGISPSLTVYRLETFDFSSFEQSQPGRVILWGN